MNVNDYRPWDQDRWLPKPPWKPTNPGLVEWEAAHGHDVRVKCYPEYGCLAIDYEKHAIEQAIETVLAELENGDHATAGRDFGRGVAHAAAHMRAALKDAYTPPVVTG